MKKETKEINNSNDMLMQMKIEKERDKI